MRNNPAEYSGILKPSYILQFPCSSKPIMMATARGIHILQIFSFSKTFLLVSFRMKRTRYLQKNHINPYFQY